MYVLSLFWFILIYDIYIYIYIILYIIYLYVSYDMRIFIFSIHILYMRIHANLCAFIELRHALKASKGEQKAFWLRIQ